MSLFDVGVGVGFDGWVCGVHLMCWDGDVSWGKLDGL